MSQTTSPKVPFDQPTASQPVGEPLGGIDPAIIEGDEFPFESSEFGVGGFLPHLDAAAPADGGTAES